MRDRSPFRLPAWLCTGAAWLACVGCLLPASLVTLAEVDHGNHGNHGDHADHTAVAQVASAAAAGHDHCWTAEVEDHQRHDDQRFESQRGLHHHAHAGVAGSSAAPVQRPVQSAHAVLPSLDLAPITEAPGSRGLLDHSPRQSRAPPRV